MTGTRGPVVSVFPSVWNPVQTQLTGSLPRRCYVRRDTRVSRVITLINRSWDPTLFHPLLSPFTPTLRDTESILQRGLVFLKLRVLRGISKPCHGRGVLWDRFGSFLDDPHGPFRPGILVPRTKTDFKDTGLTPDPVVWYLGFLGTPDPVTRRLCLHNQWVGCR